MCFSLLHNTRKPPWQKAREDIPIMKRLKPLLGRSDLARSTIFNFIYKFNKVYSQRFIKHRATTSSCLPHSHFCTEVDKGFHSYVYDKDYSNTLSRRLVKGYIPKGSWYMCNPNTAEYVSNRIVITKWLYK